MFDDVLARYQIDQTVSLALLALVVLFCQVFTVDCFVCLSLA